MAPQPGTTVNSDMIIYDDLAQTSFLERRQEVLQVFNSASNGAIQLVNEQIEGDFRKRTFYKIGGSIAHRDVNSSASVTPSKIGAGERVGVKVPYKYGPFETTEEEFKRRGLDPASFSVLVGQDSADAVLQGEVEHALAALQAAISSQPLLVAQAGWESDGKKVLTRGLRLLGDRNTRVSLFVMNSYDYFNMVDNAIDTKLYEEAAAVVYGGQPGTLGKPVLVTDACPQGVIFGLQQGAITVTESQAPGYRSYPINNQENLGIGYRAEGTFNLDVLGFSWATAAGANPDIAAVGASASWVQYATDVKSCAGVLIDLNSGS